MNLHQNLIDVLPILSEASICKETLLVSYYDTEKGRHISTKLGRLLTKKTSLSEKEVKVLVELQRRNLKGELLMSLTQDADEIVDFYKIHVAPIGGSSSCMKGEDCVRVYSYDENLFLATFYDGELADEEFYVGRTLVRKDTMEYIRTYATEQAYHDNIILTLERAGYYEGNLVGIMLAKEKTGNGWVMPYLDYYGKYVEEYTNYFEVVNYTTNLRADSTNGVMTAGVTCCNCGCVVDEDAVTYVDEGDLCEDCFYARYVYFDGENYLRADCTRVYEGAYAWELVPNELLTELDYHEVDSREGYFHIDSLVKTDSGLQYQGDCVRLEEVTAEGNSYALEEDCGELTAEERRSCPYFTTGWYLSNRYDEILEEIDTWDMLESVGQLDLVNIVEEAA